MPAVKKKSIKAMAGLRIKSFCDEEQETHITDIRVRGDVEVATIDGYICLWTAGREVRIGPLTPEQAEKLCEDLGYDAVA